MENSASTYNPKSYESRIWKAWIEADLFHADKNQKKPPYGILMPPPNVTSQLHMGHGTCYTFQDLLIRWHRMKGFAACWLPGTDHAGIATQMMVEKDLLQQEGKTRKDLGRDEFVARCQNWKDKYGGQIYSQFERIGFSADWQRKSYTMDPHLSDAVRYVFVTLYKEGLIYRGERLVNWDPVLQTAISDDEIENKEIQGQIWSLRYPIEGSDEYIVVATTRPETMLGDSAVAVHPDDVRYKHLVGRRVRLPLVDRLIPIIADDYVKSEFGSGAVKITPAHDPNDFEVGKRHNLPFIEVFNDDATMNDNVPEAYRGLDRFDARKKVVKAFKELGLFEKEESHKHSVPHSDRSKSIIEPKLSQQWYVKMAEMAKLAADAARKDELKFYPESWKKTYLYWLDNIQDWCISRQLWWGHRIPIYYCQSCQHVNCEIQEPTSCEKCGSSSLEQDEDVLDTWFSSWLWPLSPFGWPNREEEQKRQLDFFYPTNVLITAPEIIFLWVARMVMAGLKFKGKVPFRDIYFSAVVTDKQGRKFSKTLGNGIDPLEVIDKHGADAVRFTGVSQAPLGGRIAMEVGDFETGARFVNKLWNATRFLLRALGDANLGNSLSLSTLSSFTPDMPSQWLINELRVTTAKVNQCFESYRLNEGVEAIYHFIWGSFCDWGLEAAKDALSGDDESQKLEVLSVLIYVLDGALRLAHPIVPFITEELWQKLPRHPDWEIPQKSFIAVADYPSAEKIPAYPLAAEKWRAVMDLITGIRSARQQVGLPSKQILDVYIKCSENLINALELVKPRIKRLANVNEVRVGIDLDRPEQSLVNVGNGYECYIPVAGLVDFDKERLRLRTEIARIEKIVNGLNSKLGNENFIKRAPEDVVAKSTDQRNNLQNQLSVLRANLESLS